MEILGSILGLLPCLWDRTKTQLDYVRHLEENLKSLRIEKEKLMELRNDLLRKVEDAEERHMKRTERVVGWLKRVDIMITEVDGILSQGEQQIQNTCLGRCHKNCWSTYKLGKEVITKLKALPTLISEGNFNEDVLADLLPQPRVDAIPMDVPVGMDLLFKRAWSFIQDDAVHIIGIYGMGGAGKSTLLAKINNMLAERSHEFDFVIWVVVARNPNVGTIQDTIAKKLRFQEDTWSRNDQREKAGEIFRVLSKKRFVILLDDMWDPQFDLQQVGIPLGIPLRNCNSKIIITTRSEDVCGGMGADKKIKVDCLTEQMAWELFKRKVGDEALYSQPQIEDQAKLVAKECGGLPIALITVGRAMASKKTLNEWSYTLCVLQEFAWEFPKMEDKVLHLLRYSYDGLGGEMTKACFLSLSLFPEDYNFKKQNVIHNWMAEGFLKDGSLYIGTQEGHHIIGELKRACLLEAESDEYDNFRMHDVVRDMALSICSKDQNDKYLVQEWLNLTEPPPIPTWETAKLISWCGNNFKQLEGEPKCKNLLTLDLSHNGLKEIANDFFQYMPSLKVLDLSRNRELEELPKSLFKLTSLQILDLSRTGITELSPKFKKLQKLKFLGLSETPLEVIPPQVVSSLSNLEQLELLNSSLSETSINELLDELESLKPLQHLKLTVKSKTTLKKLSTSEKLYQITYGLDIKECRGTSSLQLKNNNLLQRLTIYGCEDVEEVTVCCTGNDISRKVCFRDLSLVSIYKCKLLKDVTFLMALPNIRYLWIENCPSMETIMGVGGGGASMVSGYINAFASLEQLTLQNLPSIKYICSHALPFPRLTTLDVYKCPELKRLPFDSNYDARKLTIRGDREWWAGLEWDDEAVPAILNPRIFYFSRITAAHAQAIRAAHLFKAASQF